MGPVTDLRDLRVLIPRARRAIDGPTALSSASVATTLNDDEVLGVIADGVANVILLTGGAQSFGYQLVVTSRDTNYMAPNGWATDQQMSTEAETAVIAQAAIDFFFNKFQDMKVHEAIADEGQSWDWDKSPALVRDQLKLLGAVRDKALANLAALNVPLDSFISFVAERDKLAAIWVEPWVSEIGAPVPFTWGGDLSGHDSRFLGPGEAWW